MATRAWAVNEAARAAISARDFCGNEAQAIADAGADYGIAFTSHELAVIAVKVAAVWAQARADAGVTARS